MLDPTLKGVPHETVHIKAAPSDEPKRSKPRKLQVTVHFRRDDVVLHVALKLTVPASYEDRPCRAAVVEPFMKAYAKKHPDAPAGGSVEVMRVQCWSGPRPSAADSFPVERPPEVEAKFRAAMAPTYYMIHVDVTVSELRSRAPDGQHIDVELVPAESTALVVRDMPSSALVVQGERLLAMLDDPEAELAEMHALVDAAAAKGELAYIGATMARDARGRTPLHLAVRRAGPHVSLCEHGPPPSLLRR
jgi:hypothetical protein